MINQRFLYLSGLLVAGGSLSYALDTLRGRVRPNRATWFMWALAPLTAAFVQWRQHVGPLAGLTLVVGLGPAAVFATSFFNRGAYWKLRRLDFACLGASMSALVMWVVFGEGVLALGLALAADIFVAVPTTLKAIQFPASESPGFYLGNALGALVALLTLNELTFLNSGFAAYVVIYCALMVMLIVRGRRSWSGGVVRH